MDILYADEGHLYVDLGKLRLPIHTEVFIPETLNNLEISIKPGDHKQLLEELRRLGKCIETPRVDPTRDQVVPRTLRGTPGQNGSLDLQKPLVVQTRPHCLGHLVTEYQVPLKPRPP